MIGCLWDCSSIRIALPSASDKLFSSSSDGTVHVWDYNTGQSIRAINLGVKIGTLISEGPWIFVGLPNIVKASLHLTCSASSNLVSFCLRACGHFVCDLSGIEH